MSAAAVSPPSATPKQTDPTTGFALMAQPMALTATSPLLSNGSPLSYKGPGSEYTLDAATAKAGFTYGALLYRNTSGIIDIYDGNGHWISQSTFDPSSSSIKPSAFAFDQTKNQWTGTFVISTLPNAGGAGFATDPVSGSPKYGFLGLFVTPKTSPSTAVRSALTAPFGIATADNSLPVKAGLLAGSAPTQDPKSADGFSIVVTDSTQRPVADLILSRNASLPEVVALHFYSGGVVRAAVSIEPATGKLRLMSATQVTIDAPQVVVNGTLQAQNISYVPYGGGASRFL